MSVRARLAGTFSSNTLGYAVTLFVQIASVPLLIGMWGPTLYGEWLIASTIPGYLALSDFGLSSALANDMAMNASRGDHKPAIGAFQSIGVVILLIGPAVLLSLFAITSLLPIGAHMGLSLIKGRDFVLLTILLGAQVWFSQIHGVLQAGFRSAGYYAAASAGIQVLRLADFGALAAAVLSGGGPIAAVASIIAVRIAATGAALVLLRIWVPWLTIGVMQFRWEAVKRLLHPGVMFLVFPLTTALNIQTPVLVIGMVFGPETAAVFSTARTLSRAVQQLLNIIINTIYPEVSRAYGTGDHNLIKKLYRLSVSASLWVSCLGAGLVAIAGPYLYGTWTRHTISLDPVLLDLLLLVTVCNSSWFAASVVFTATNRHARMAKQYLVINLVAVPAYWALAKTVGLDGVTVGLILCELATAAFVLPESLKLVGDRLSDLAQATMVPWVYLRSLRFRRPG